MVCERIDAPCSGPREVGLDELVHQGGPLEDHPRVRLSDKGDFRIWENRAKLREKRNREHYVANVPELHDEYTGRIWRRRQWRISLTAALT